MSRSRNLKPGFFKNEDLAELPFEVRILYQGLWCLADREGRMEDRPKRIKAEVFPYDDVDVNVGLSMLADSGFIVRYETDGGQYIQVLTFLKHQNPHCKEAPSTIPARCKPGASPEITGTGPADSLDLIPDSLDLIGDAAASPPRKRGKQPKVPMPDGFGISERVRRWAVEKRHSRLDEHMEAFQAKCRAHGYVYADWDEAFMEAVRNDWAKLPAASSAVQSGKPAGPSETPLERQLNWIAEMVRRGQMDDDEALKQRAAATSKHREPT